jgi:hypothetical protein
VGGGGGGDTYENNGNNIRNFLQSIWDKIKEQIHEEQIGNTIDNTIGNFIGGTMGKKTFKPKKLVKSTTPHSPFPLDEILINHEVKTMKGGSFFVFSKLIPFTITLAKTFTWGHVSVNELLLFMLTK